MSKVLVQRHDRHWEVRLNRPREFNCIDTEVLDQLALVFAEAETVPSLRVIQLRGNGGVFCSGADLHHMSPMFGDPVLLKAFLQKWQDTFNQIENSSKITIAVIEKFALAGGLELLLVCDLAIAAEQTKIGDQHANFGFIPGGGGTQRLPRAIGMRRAKELMYSGKHISVEKALEWGLIQESAAEAELDALVKARVETLVAKSAVGLARMKYLMQKSTEMDLADGLNLELKTEVEHLQSADAHIGLKAFANRTRPVFE